ncbi:fimbrial protein [Citrobacter braakii]|uniref:fimbrial protein n=1 Tax=Citrobacter braakii TaxID=57706 RepID=UPI0040396E98
MKLTKLALVLGFGISMATGVATAADQGHGTVTFEGSIVDAPCSINSDSVDQTVQLGQVAASSLEDGGTSTPAKFSIKLGGCDVTTITDGVSITFTGNADATTADNLAFGAGSSAKGASIALADGEGKVIPLGTTSDPIALNGGDNTLNFQAYLVGGTASVTPGSFTSVTNFTLAYN